MFSFLNFSCIVIKQTPHHHDNGLHKGWFKSFHNPHNKLNFHYEKHENKNPQNDRNGNTSHDIRGNGNHYEHSDNQHH